MSGLGQTMRLGSDLFQRIESACHVGYLSAPFEVNHHLNLEINTTTGFTIRDSASVVDSFESLVGRFGEYAVLFTDGSRAEVGGAVRVGFAVVVPHLHLTVRVRLSDYSAIYDEELLALECALQQIAKLDLPRAIIFSDSLSALNSLSFADYKGSLHPAVYRIKSIPYSFNKSGRRVGFCWIPAHPDKDIPGNESANAAAKEALLLPDSLMIAKCHYTNLYSRFKKDAKSDAINIIKSEAEDKGSRYFNKIDTILAPPWY